MNRRQFSLRLASALGFVITEPRQLQNQLRINGDRLNEHLRALAELEKPARWRQPLSIQ
jgi:hypothetical protein